MKELKQLLRDAFHEGNNNASMPESDWATCEEDFENWFVKNQEKVKNLTLPQVSVSLPREKRYEIDFGGNVLTEISIVDNEINVIQAINGYGDAVEKDKIRITERQRMLTVS